MDEPWLSSVIPTLDGDGSGLNTESSSQEGSGGIAGVLSLVGGGVWIVRSCFSIDSFPCRRRSIVFLFILPLGFPIFAFKL